MKRSIAHMINEATIPYSLDRKRVDKIFISDKLVRDIADVFSDSIIGRKVESLDEIEKKIRNNEALICGCKIFIDPNKNRDKYYYTIETEDGSKSIGVFNAFELVGHGPIDDECCRKCKFVKKYADKGIHYVCSKPTEMVGYEITTQELYICDYYEKKCECSNCDCEKNKL